MDNEDKGQPQTAEDKAAENPVVRDKNRRKGLLFVAAGAVLVLLAVIVLVIVAAGNDDKKIQEQLELGAKYLEEMEYEQALVAFYTALSIEPKNPDAYLGIVEVCIRTNDFESALEYAKEGYEATGDERLKEKIDMIENGSIFASNGWLMKGYYYDSDGNMTYWHEYTYNLKGQKAAVTVYNAQGVQEQYLEFVYDEKGRFAIDAVEYVTGEIARRITEYREHSRWETIFIGTSDTVHHYCEWELDSNGKILRMTDYNIDRQIDISETFTYDENGREVRRERYNGNNELTNYYVSVYDETGKQLQWLSYTAEGELISNWDYIYDEEGNYLGYRIYEDGVLQNEYRN